MTKIIRCTCEHKGQDKMYGEKMRVHNLCKPKESVPKWRCTVCKAERN